MFFFFFFFLILMKMQKESRRYKHCCNEFKQCEGKGGGETKKKIKTKTVLRSFQKKQLLKCFFFFFNFNENVEGIQTIQTLL